MSHRYATLSCPDATFVIHNFPSAGETYDLDGQTFLITSTTDWKAHGKMFRRLTLIPHPAPGLLP